MPFCLKSFVSLEISERGRVEALRYKTTYSCESNSRSVANGLKVLSCNGAIRRHGEIYGRQHGLN